jgi:hypothetical protein
MTMDFKTDNGLTITDEMFDKMAEEYEKGTWSGHGEIIMGRPKIYDEDLETISFRLPKSRVNAIEAITARIGKTRSEFLREAVDRALIESAKSA